MALAATAIVHPANNIFKVALVGRKADLGIVLKFALPAVSAAKLGALLLNYMAAAQPIAAYVLGGRACSITAMKLVIAFLIMVRICTLASGSKSLMAINPHESSALYL